jgi:hypothetical protein
VVLGRLRTRSWETPEGKAASTEIDADEVTPSLRWAIAKCERAERSRNGRRAAERALFNDEPRSDLSKVMARIRLEGDPEECDEAAPWPAELFDVCRSATPAPTGAAAVCLEIRLSDQRHADADGAAERRPQATIRPAGRDLAPP